MSLARQGAAFVFVGLAATATHVLIALALNGVLHVDPLIANGVAYGCGLVVSYAGNALMTFGAPLLRAGQFVRFATVSLTGFVINQSTVYLGVRLLHWPLAAALAPAVVLAAGVTFVLARTWAFRQPKAQPASTARVPTVG